MSVEWERAVKRSEDACSGCGVRFGPGAEVVTALDFGPQGFLRDDRCPACFAAAGREPFSFWRHHRPKDFRPGPRRLDLAYLTEFFKRLAARGIDDANAARVFYIVALLLLRRRILEETGRRREGDDEVLRVRLKREDLEYDVKDPRLDPTAMTSIEEDLARIFNLDQSAPTEPA